LSIEIHDASPGKKKGQLLIALRSMGCREVRNRFKQIELSPAASVQEAQSSRSTCASAVVAGGGGAGHAERRVRLPGVSTRHHACPALLTHGVVGDQNLFAVTMTFMAGYLEWAT
jgi:hypothetical protein